mgnify:CR=1 FL=1
MGAQSGERGTFDVSTKRSVAGSEKPPPTQQTCRSCCCMFDCTHSVLVRASTREGKGQAEHAAAFFVLFPLSLSPFRAHLLLPCGFDTI